MRHKGSLVLLVVSALAALPLAGSSAAASKAGPAIIAGERENAPVLWREPSDIGSRNLYYGPGGERDQPHGPYTFVEEDTAGSNPKYIVRDRDNVKWTVKLGMEARPETVATRLVWAAGYFTNEDYFVEELQVSGMPARVKRGRKLIGPGGIMRAARLKRHLQDEQMAGNWYWRRDPFSGTRELNGLKVMMALINNWDLKDVNNKIYAEKDSDEQFYEVADLGAAFGSTGLSFPFSRSKGNLKAYVRSKFIRKITPEYVDFQVPTRPSLVYAYSPFGYFRRTRLDTILHHVPRDDVRWMGHVLSGLSEDQIRDAFRAAGYSPGQIEAFSAVVRERITELNDL